MPGTKKEIPLDLAFSRWMAVDNKITMMTLMKKRNVNNMLPPSIKAKTVSDDNYCISVEIKQQL